MSILKYKVDGSGRLHERIVIVTGASLGMGRGIALALARKVGHVVSPVCSDIREECAQHGFEEDKHIPNHTVIANNGGIAAYQKCDISNTAEIFALIEFAIKIFSRIDIFINNAAVWWAFRDLIEETDEQWDIMMAVNGKGCATAMREAIKDRSSSTSPNLVHEVGQSISPRLQVSRLFVEKLPTRRAKAAVTILLFP